MIKLTKEEQYNHNSRKYCFSCKKTFFEDAKNNYNKVKDHCHYTGKYRGAAHKICNLMYNTPREYNSKVDKKAKGTKKCAIKRCLIFDNYSEYLKEKNENIKISTKI